MSISAFTDTLIATVIIYLSYFREKNIYNSFTLLQQIRHIILAHDLIFLLLLQNHSVVVHKIIYKIYQLLKIQKKKKRSSPILSPRNHPIFSSQLILQI